MQRLIALLLLACATTLALATPSASLTGEAINTNCPVMKGAIDGKTFVEYDGHSIGFCCPGCDSKFLAWDKSKKDAFVKASLAAQTAANATKALPAPDEPYTLSTCPVSGKKLGSMGEPVAVEADGSQVLLCCKGCKKSFEADTAKFMKAVNEALAAEQKPYYPMDTCVVSGEPLTEKDKDIAQDVLIGNRLFRVCCKSCIKALRKEPGKYLAELDAAVIKAQAKGYPLKTCIVRTKSKLGSMGKPTQKVLGNRLVQFCCAGCEPAFDENPRRYIQALEAAWSAKREAAEKRTPSKGLRSDK
jgi:YHS domain-containing protein